VNRQTSFALLAGSLAALVALAVAEGALELIDYPASGFSPWIRVGDTGYGYAASYSTRMTRPGEYDVSFVTNAEGFRDDDVGPKRGLRVLLLGDSFASGYGVERSEMFADLLEARLGVEVLNAAVGGYEIVHQVRFFATRGRALDPDLVIYALYLGNDLSRNDEWRLASDGTLESLERSFPLRAERSTKLGLLYRQLRYRAKLRDEQRRGDWEPWPDYLLSAERQPGEEASGDYRDVEMFLTQLRDAVARSGARLLVVMIPYRQMVEPAALDALREQTPGFDDRYDLSLPAKRTTEILARLGIDHYDLTPAFRAHFDQGEGPLFFAVDGHLNPAGNAAVAQALAPVLAARINTIGAPRGDQPPH
jgi:lysophospholipase L1-like esterase